MRLVSGIGIENGLGGRHAQAYRTLVPLFPGAPASFDNPPGGSKMTEFERVSVRPLEVVSTDCACGRGIRRRGLATVAWNLHLESSGSARFDVTAGRKRRHPAPGFGDW